MKVTWSVVAFLAVVAVAGACRIPDSKPAADPVETTLVGWVVEAINYSRGTDTHTVTCIPAGDVALPTGQRRWADVETDAATANSVVEGGPCPAGPVVDQYPPGVAG